MPARFAPHPFRDYWREWAVALLLAAIGAAACWWMWARLPHQVAQPTTSTGSVHDIQPGLPSGGKYTLVHGRIAVIDVVMPGGGVQRFTGDGRLLERCRRGDPVRLTRYANDLGQATWALKADACGGAR